MALAFISITAAAKKLPADVERQISTAFYLEPNKISCGSKLGSTVIVIQIINPLMSKSRLGRFRYFGDVTYQDDFSVQAL